MSTTRELISLALSNGGFITSREASALGASRTSLSRRVAEGSLFRIQDGLYALPGTASRDDVLLRAAARSLNAVVSHESAAAIHELAPIQASIPTVSVLRRGTNRFPDVRVHQLTDLIEAHTQLIDGLRVTDPERTVIDLGTRSSERRMQSIIENGLDSSTLDGDRLLRLFASIGRRGKPGTKRMRRVLQETLGEPIRADSVLERRLLSLIRDSGLPLPDQQVSLPWLRKEAGRVDFAYTNQQLVIEADGRRWHARSSAFESDRQRDNSAQLAGWRLLRFTWSMVHDEPQEVVRTIRIALANSA